MRSSFICSAAATQKQPQQHMEGSGTAHMPQLKVDHALTPHREQRAAALQRSSINEYGAALVCSGFKRNTSLLVESVRLKVEMCWESSCPVRCDWGCCPSSHPQGCPVLGRAGLRDSSSVPQGHICHLENQPHFLGL